MHIVGPHEPPDSVDTVVDVAERASLFAVAPDLHGRIAAQLCRRHFAAHRSRSLFATATPRALRPVDIVKPRNARLKSVVLAIVRAKSLGGQLFPPVSILRLRWIHVFL